MAQYSGSASIFGSDDQGSIPAVGNHISIVGKLGLATGVNKAAPLGDGMTCGSYTAFLTAVPCPYPRTRIVGQLGEVLSYKW